VFFRHPSPAYSLFAFIPFFIPSRVDGCAADLNAMVTCNSCGIDLGAEPAARGWRLLRPGCTVGGPAFAPMSRTWGGTAGGTRATSVACRAVGPL
jgi:hypothetical protein